MWAFDIPLGPVRREGAPLQTVLLERAINWAPSAELRVSGENLKAAGARVTKTFSKYNILIKYLPNL
jgi:hypothetical protein